MAKPTNGPKIDITTKTISIRDNVSIQPNKAYTPSQTSHKQKSTPVTKRQYYGDSAQDQKATKQVLENTSKLPHLITPIPESRMHGSTQKPLPRDLASQTIHAPPHSLELGLNDSSFLEQILAGVKPAQPNLNTYTQIALQIL